MSNQQNRQYQQYQNQQQPQQQYTQIGTSQQHGNQNTHQLNSQSYISQSNQDQLRQQQQAYSVSQDLSTGRIQNIPQNINNSVPITDNNSNQFYQVRDNPGSLGDWDQSTGLSRRQQTCPQVQMPQGEQNEIDIEEEKIETMYIDNPNNDLVFSIQCSKCNNGQIKLDKNEVNQFSRMYKKAECQNNSCSQNVYYLFCECNELIYSYQEFGPKKVIECSKKCDKIQKVPHKELESNSQCHGFYEISVKRENLTNQFYTQADCSGCQNKMYYFYCKCSQIIYQFALPFYYGQILQCKNDLQQCPYTSPFQLVRCPIDNCASINLFKKCNYDMGTPIQCHNCKNCFQQVVCASVNCRDSLYFAGEYSKGNFVECPCKTQFQQVTCPQCFKAQFRQKDIDGQIFSGQSITCENMDCKAEFYIAICPVCKDELDYTNLSQKFQEGKYYTCDECNLEIEWYVCGRNHVSNNVISKSQRQQMGADYNFGLRQCKFPNCDSNVFISCCYHCKKINKNFEGKIEDKLKCQHCNKPYNTIKCEKCNSTNSFLAMGKINTRCKWCQTSLETGNIEDENQGVCKACFTEQAIYIFSECMHLISCESCEPQMRQQGRCPICRRPGVTKKVYF